MRHPQSILITGASSGIGEALALHYARDGVYLALSGRNRERLEDVAERCRTQGAEVVPEVIDVTDAAAMQAWIARIDEAKPLDLVIANAGVGIAPSKEVSLQEATERTFAVNVHGVFNTIHPALERMKARNAGQIAVMSSIAGYLGLSTAVPYSASKVAVKAYAEALRGAYWGRVEVNVICPGFVESRMTARNRFPMPFLWGSEKAARVIARRLARNTAVIAFPWPMVLFLGTLSRLPRGLAIALLRRRQSGR